MKTLALGITAMQFGMRADPRFTELGVYLENFYNLFNNGDVLVSGLKFTT